jgi:hypothetical protein
MVSGKIFVAYFDINTNHVTIPCGQNSKVLNFNSMLMIG